MRGPSVQETECPQCGEWLSVPPEYADRPVRCGNCGRVIATHERGHAPVPPPPPPPAGPRFPAADPPRSRGPRFPDRDDDTPDRPRRKGGLVWVWLLLAGVAIGGCCLCGVAGIAFMAANPPWEAYTAEGGAFAAEFPGKPKYETKPFKWKDDTEGTGHQYTAVQLLNAQGFAVHYADLPKGMQGVRPSDDALLKAGLEDFKKNATNFTQLNSARQTIGKYEALDVEATVTDPQAGILQVFVRTLIVGDRVFMLFAAGKDRAKLAPDKDRFFNSFKPADPKGK